MTTTTQTSSPTITSDEGWTYLLDALRTLQVRVTYQDGTAAHDVVIRGWTWTDPGGMLAVDGELLDAEHSPTGERVVIDLERIANIEVY